MQLYGLYTRCIPGLAFRKSAYDTHVTSIGWFNFNQLEISSCYHVVLIEKVVLQSLQKLFVVTCTFEMFWYTSTFVLKLYE